MCGLQISVTKKIWRGGFRSSFSRRLPLQWHVAVVMNSGLWGWGLIGQDCFLPEETLQCELNRQEEQSRGESDLPQFVNVHCFIN